MNDITVKNFFDKINSYFNLLRHSDELNSEEQYEFFFQKDNQLLIEGLIKNQIIRLTQCQLESFYNQISNSDEINSSYNLSEPISISMSNFINIYLIFKKNKSIFSHENLNTKIDFNIETLNFNKYLEKELF